MSTETRRWPAATAAGVMVVAALAVSACGGGGGGSGADDGGDEVATLGTDPASAPDGSAPTDSSLPTDPEEAAILFAECMREHGVDMPDPGAGGMIEIAGTPDNADELDAAMEECSPIMENARRNIEIDPEQEAEMREQLLEFAECMREHGIDMPDPVFDDNGGVTMQVGEEGDDGGAARPDFSDDEFQAAQEECGAGIDGMVAAGPVGSAPVGSQP